jgi:hypothetical protein
VTEDHAEVLAIFEARRTRIEAMFDRIQAQQREVADAIRDAQLSMRFKN